jgi:Flp pilus assembly protein TadG
MFGRLWLGLAKDQAGSLSTVTALLMPALMAAAGLGADTLHWTLQQRIMQRQAESAALAGAEALSQNRAVAETVQAQLAAGPGPAFALAPIIEQGPSSGPFAGDPLVVRVRLSSIAHLPFSGLFSAAGVPISVEATAGLVEERMAGAIHCDGCTTPA